jgi:hypothetical protein
MKVLASIALALALPVPARAAVAPIRLLSWESVALAQRCAADYPKESVRAAVVTKGYGLCDVADVHTGGEVLYRVVGRSFAIVGAGGGQMAASDMADLYHIPMAIGTALTSLRTRVYREKKPQP